MSKTPDKSSERPEKTDKDQDSAFSLSAHFRARASASSCDAATRTTARSGLVSPVRVSQEIQCGPRSST